MSERKLRRARERDAAREEKRRKRLALTSGAALGAAVLFAPGAQAATFQVTTAEDENDGVDACETDPADCSLREAVNEANQYDDGDVVTFASAVTGTIELTMGDISIDNGGLAIQGPGAGVLTISGEDNDRIFKLLGFSAPNEQISISGLTLADGSETGDGGAIQSENFLFGGDNFYPGDLTLTNAVIASNDADGTGGAISAVGTYYFSGNFYDGYAGDLTITNSELTDNDADGAGGGIYVENDEAGRTVTITNSTLSGNASAADNGGGAYLDAGTVTITGSTFSGNYAYNDGGAVHVQDTAGSQQTEVTIAASAFSGNTAGDDGGALKLRSPDGDALVSDSTMSGNTANDGGALDLGVMYEAVATTIVTSTISGNSAGDGGGIRIQSPLGPVTIRNSTLSGNSIYSDVGAGGGIFALNENDVPVTITNSTIAANSAPEGGGVFRSASDDPAYEGDDTIDLSSTIVADNTGADLHDGDGAGSFATGFSLIENAGNAALTQSPAGTNILGVDPQLAPLADNGGPTQTHLPAQSSPAVDNGIANGLATEQRGLARTFDISAIANAAGGDGTDIGSVEIAGADCLGVGVFSIAGTAGNDVLTGDAGANAIFGRAGNDSLAGVDGNDCLFGEDGDDTADGGNGNDLVDGGAGNDGLAGAADNDTVNGQAGKDNARGGPGADRVKGQGGKDKVKGNGGKDRAKGGPGRDNLKGGGGKDKVSGQGGKDRLSGGGGKDKLKGGPGKDRIRTTGGGKDKVNCGGGNDKVIADERDRISQNCETVVEPG